MTLSSRHRIRNSSPGGLRPSTLPLGHGGSPQYWLSHVDGGETFFVSFKPPRPGTEPRTLAWKAAVLTTTLGPPPTCWMSIGWAHTNQQCRWNKPRIMWWGPFPLVRFNPRGCHIIQPSLNPCIISIYAEPARVICRAGRKSNRFFPHRMAKTHGDSRKWRHTDGLSHVSPRVLQNLWG